MAKILRNESSLLHRQNAIARELGLRKFTRFAVWGAALAILLWGGATAILQQNIGGGLVGVFVLILAIGYEVHLREIAKESLFIEGGRRGEKMMADLLAEQLADDHVILNDLELRIAHERSQIDHLVIAPSGIYVIESKYWVGKLTGDVRDAQWTQRKSNGSTRSVKSPVQQCERQRRMFITLLAARVPEDRIYALAVFTHSAVELRITNGKDRVFRTREALRFINDRCFNPPILTPAEALELAERISRGQT